MTQTVLLGDIATINMGQSPKSASYNSVGEGLPFMQGVRTFGRIYPKIDTWCTAPTKVADAGDVLLSVRAPVGDLNYAPERMCIGRGLASLKSRNNKFLYYLIEANKERLISSQTGSVFGSVNATMLKNFKLTVPDNNETQDKIADILGTIDEKIELNRKMNETLEQIGQALFRHYFIDNPEAEKWENGTIADLGSAITGKTPNKSKAEYYGNDVMFLKVPDMHGQQIIIKTEDMLSLQGADSQSKKYIPKWSTCVSCIATVGVVSLAGERLQTNQQVNSIVPKEKEYVSFNYYLLKSISGKLKTMASSGSATPNLNKGHFESIKIKIPPTKTLEMFWDETESTLAMLDKNTREIQTLTTIRDTLLPRLISGKIEV